MGVPTRKIQQAQNGMRDTLSTYHDFTDEEIAAIHSYLQERATRAP